MAQARWCKRGTCSSKVSSGQAGQWIGCAVFCPETVVAQAQNRWHAARELKPSSALCPPQPPLQVSTCGHADYGQELPTHRVR